MTAIDKAKKWLADDGDCYYSKTGCAVTAQIMRDLIADVERLQLIISGKTQYDVEQATATRCRDIAKAQMLAPPGAWGKGATFNAEKIARLIKEEYGLSD